MQRRQLPFLDVRSDFLVYVTNVPSTLNGKDLKSRINAQYGIVKFIETFEAWARRRIGCIVIEFSTFDGSDAFMRAAIEHRIPYLGDVGVQHVGIVGRRHFFELIHRDTDIDLLDCNGQPSDNWRRYKRDRPAQRSKPYNRETFNRGAKPKQITEEGDALPRAQRHNSPSSDESVGPFPSSRALRKLIKFSVWQSKTTGRTHILTFDSSVKKQKLTTSPPIGQQIIGRSISPLIKKNRIKTTGFGNNKIINHDQIISERLDRLRAKYNKEAASKKLIGDGGCFIPLASKRRNSIVRPSKPSAAVLPMKMTEDLEDGEIPDEEENEDGELGEEPMELCSDQEDKKKLMVKPKVRLLGGFKNGKKDDKLQKNKTISGPKNENKAKTENENQSPQKSQKILSDSGNYSCTEDILDFDFPFELVEGDCSPGPKMPLVNTNSIDLVSNKIENPKENRNEFEDEIIDVEGILEGESIAGDIDESCLEDNFTDNSPSTCSSKIQIKSASNNEPSGKFATINEFFGGEGTTTKIGNVKQRCSSTATTTTTGLEHSIYRMSIGRQGEMIESLNRSTI